MKHMHNNDKNLHEIEDKKEFVVSAGLIAGGMVALAVGGGAATLSTGALIAGWATAAVVAGGLSYGLYAGGTALMGAILPGAPELQNPFEEAEDLEARAANAEAEAETEAKRQVATRSARIEKFGKTRFTGATGLEDEDKSIYAPTLLGGTR